MLCANSIFVPYANNFFFFSYGGKLFASTGPSLSNKSIVISWRMLAKFFSIFYCNLYSILIFYSILALHLIHLGGLNEAY